MIAVLKHRFACDRHHNGDFVIFNSVHLLVCSCILFKISRFTFPNDRTLQRGIRWQSNEKTLNCVCAWFYIHDMGNVSYYFIYISANSYSYPFLGITKYSKLRLSVSFNIILENISVFSLVCILHFILQHFFLTHSPLNATTNR